MSGDREVWSIDKAVASEAPASLGDPFFDDENEALLRLLHDYAYCPNRHNREIPDFIAEMQLLEAQLNKDLTAAQELLEREDAIGRTPLVAAVCSGNIRAARQLLEWGADTSVLFRGKTLLELAARAQVVSVERHWVKRGEYLHDPERSIFKPKEGDELVALKEFQELVDIPLIQVVFPEWYSYLSSLQAMAMRFPWQANNDKHHIDCHDAIVAELSVPSESGNHHFDMARLTLMQTGKLPSALIDAEDEEGQTPLDIAIKTRHFLAAIQLVNWGASCEDISSAHLHDKSFFPYQLVKRELLNHLKNPAGLENFSTLVNFVLGFGLYAEEAVQDLQLPYWAAKYERWPIVEKLLAAGHRPSAPFQRLLSEQRAMLSEFEASGFTALAALVQSFSRPDSPAFPFRDAVALAGHGKDRRSATPTTPKPTTPKTPPPPLIVAAAPIGPPPAALKPVERTPPPHEVPQASSGISVVFQDSGRRRSLSNGVPLDTPKPAPKPVSNGSSVSLEPPA